MSASVGPLVAHVGGSREINARGKRSGRAILIALFVAVWITPLIPGNASASVPSATDGPARQARLALLTDWPQFHNTPDRVGVNSSEALLDAQSVAGLQAKWSYATGASIDESSPAVAGGMVYIGSTDSKLYALNALTGLKVWSAKTSNEVSSSPAVAGGLVYVGSNDGRVYAFNALTGVKVWSFRTKYAIAASSPAVANGTVYIGSLDGYLYALDALTGAQKWRSPHIWKIRKSPSVAGGLVYVGTDKGNVYAFDAATGVQRWAATIGAYVRDTPTVAGGTAFVGAEDYSFYAFNASTGALRWKVGPLPGKPVIRSAPAVWNGRVYVTTGETEPMGGHIYVFDGATGAAVCNHTMADYSTVSPAIAGGVAYAASTDGQVYAFDAMTCDKLWTSGYGTIGAGMDASPAVVNGMLYIGSHDGKVYGFADLTPPDMEFTSAPAWVTNATSAAFSFQTTEATVGPVTCQLDARLPVDCSGGTFSAAGLSEGPHTLSILATDLSGNFGSSLYAWVVDVTVPTLVIESGPDGSKNTGYTNIASAKFNLESSEPGEFLCQLDDLPQGSCPGWVTFDGLLDGPHTFTGWAVDLAGNLSTPQTESWVQDTVAPTIWAEGPSAVSTDSATFTFSSNEDVDFRCSEDGGPFGACTSPYTMDKLLDGTHTFAVYATDPAWNSSDVATLAFTVDAPPTTWILSGPDDPTTSTSATFLFAADQSDVTYRCSLDAAPFASCQPGIQYTGLSPGTHWFAVYATDPAGNGGEAVTYKWKIT